MSFLFIIMLYALLRQYNGKKPYKKNMMPLSKIIPRTLFIFQKIKKYLKKQIYKIKRSNKDIISKYKAKLIANSFEQ